MKDYITKTLIENGFECFIVGGAVRDLLLGIPCQDTDFATNAHPNQIINLFPNDKVNLVGETFKVVIVNGIEVATYRKDVYFGGSHKNCEISYADTIEEDLSRRDLTINAMAMNVNTGEIIDPFNGREDLRNNTIRFVGNPEDRINEDPNRILRALRFASKYGFPLSRDTFDTLRIIRENSNKFDLIAKERVYGEIMKVMEIQDASNFFRFAHLCGILGKMFPSLENCVNHIGGKHHGEDVFTHCMIAGDSLNTGCKMLKLAGYLHDVGKPVVYDKLTDTFINHEKVGSDVVYQELVNLRFPVKEAEYISKLVHHHMRMTCSDMSEKASRKLVADLNSAGINYRDHIRLKIADRRANLKKTPLTFSEIKTIINHYERVMVNFRIASAYKDLAINGRDVMEFLNVPSGPKVGETLRKAFEAVLNCEVENEKSALLNYIMEA